MHGGPVPVTDEGPELTMHTLKEFSDKELEELEERGISPYHMARFLEALRNNVDPSSLRRLFAQQESEDRDQSDWYI
ncbi:MAG: hypothetical protein ACE5JQ_07695 [Candidatus Methylomirabilales bacterium]